MRKQGTYLRKDTGSLHTDGENYSTKQGMAHLHSGHPDPWPRSSPPRVERPGQRHPDSLCSCTVIPFPAQQRLNKARSMHSDKWEVCWSITLPGGLWFCATCWPRLPVEQSEVPSTWASMRGRSRCFRRWVTEALPFLRQSALSRAPDHQEGLLNARLTVSIPGPQVLFWFSYSH